MTRYVHSDDWADDVCPNFPETPPPGHYYSPNTKRSHDCPKVDGDEYPPGDRLTYMTCKNCGSVIWGFSKIEEDPI